jgi:hypothetical protein
MDGLQGSKEASSRRRKPNSSSPLTERIVDREQRVKGNKVVGQLAFFLIKKKNNNNNNKKRS